MWRPPSVSHCWEGSSDQNECFVKSSLNNKYCRNHVGPSQSKHKHGMAKGNLEQEILVGR